MLIGYIVSQFLATNTNKRTDRYGGSVNGRIRFAVELVEAVAAAIGPERTGLRISPGHTFNDIHDEKPLETHFELLKAIKTEELAYVHLLTPTAFSERMNNGGDPEAILPAFRPLVKGKLMWNGRLTKESAEKLLQEKLIDVASFGRLFISNPDLVERLRTGKALTEPKEELFYTPGPLGYTDYPTAV